MHFTNTSLKINQVWLDIQKTKNYASQTNDSSPTKKYYAIRATKKLKAGHL